MLLALALAASLQIQTFTASPEGFLVTSTLVSGEKDAVLIDSAFTLPDARKLVAGIQASGKNLTTIYVTHDHPDHYFGAQAVLAAFPKAKLVALPAVAAQIRKTWAGKVKQWQPLYKDAIAAKPSLPAALKGKTISLEGENLEIHGVVQGDDSVNSYLFIPSLKTVVAGDIVYDGVHVWTADTTPAGRKAWAATLDEIGALSPAKVVPGHQSPVKVQDPANVKSTREYLASFDEARAASNSSDELQQKIKAKYPGLALEVILKLGADQAFAAK